MAELISRLPEFEFTLHSAVTSLPAPALVTDGAAMTEMTDKPRDWALSIDFSATATLTDGTLCAYDATAGKWRAIAVLNEGVAISGTATLGWEDTFVDIAAAGTRFAIKGTLSTGNVTIKLRPLGVSQR